MDNSAISSNKRIAKNTLMLYLRMFLTMIVGFFTSRIVLQALGVNDYGIFNLVGGIVVLINVLTSSLSSTTSRFLSFEMGVADKERAENTSMAECRAATSTFAQYGVGKFFKAQL